MRTKEYVDEKLLRELADAEPLKKIIKGTKEFDDYTIRILRENYSIDREKSHET